MVSEKAFEKTPRKPRDDCESENAGFICTILFDIVHNTMYEGWTSINVGVHFRFLDERSIQLSFKLLDSIDRAYFSPYKATGTMVQIYFNHWRTPRVRSFIQLLSGSILRVNPSRWRWFVPIFIPLPKKRARDGLTQSGTSAQERFTVFCSHKLSVAPPLQ